ncbi:MAG: Crp/Fnr family transcriptional regulator [Acidobacteria bacterium]|nr:Crp/Fnr family transcriptional regulator [Acidobacteriota bacterium]
MADKNQIYFSRHIVCDDLSRLMKEHMPEEVTFGRNAEFPKGSYVWREEDEADSIFFLRSGQIAVKITDAKGHEVIVRVIGEGEPFGELCLCSEGRGERRTSACAVIPSEAVEVSVNDFIDFLQQHHEALKNLLFMFCIRLADAERRIEVLAYRGAEERLGRLLLSLASSSERETGDDSGEITLPISHEELAQMAALSRAHTTVTMGKFRQRGVVRYKRGQPVIVDVQALAKYLNQRERGG